MERITHRWFRGWGSDMARDLMEEFQYRSRTIRWRKEDLLDMREREEDIYRIPIRIYRPSHLSNR